MIKANHGDTEAQKFLFSAFPCLRGLLLSQRQFHLDSLSYCVSAADYTSTPCPSSVMNTSSHVGSTCFTCTLRNHAFIIAAFSEPVVYALRPPHRAALPAHQLTTRLGEQWGY